MVVRLVPILPGKPEYPRDTFAGKTRVRNFGPHQSCEKVVEILPAKVSRRCPYQVTILGTTVVYPQLYGSENQVIYIVLLKIVTWYGHLRDTFAGKILTTFHKYFPLPENLKRFYRQKCRAT